MGLCFFKKGLIMKYFLIFTGSGIGGVMRYLVSAALPSAGILIVNISGCFVMGFLMTVFTSSLFVSEEIRLAILVGVLGGYTTFSSFGREVMLMISSGSWLEAALYVAFSNVGAILAVFLGALLAGRCCNA
jgi:CrcB protein